MSLVNIASSEYIKLPGAPGKSLTVAVSGIGGNTFDCELYSLPGIISRPHPGAIGVVLNAGGQRIIVGTHNYNLETDIDTGETLIHSVDESGNKKARIILKNDGKIIAENDIESLKTLINDLIAAVKAIITTGSPVSQAVSPASQAALDVIDARFNQLLGV